jgi:AcrR family transcriptional regulator
LEIHVGRPREFDVEKAVASAQELFWRKGYEGTSLSDLTQAMGIVPPSFYFTFKSKEKLFERVLERYRSGHQRYFDAALNEPNAEAVAKSLLHGFADAHTVPGQPAGCLGINCAMPCADSDDPVRLALANLRATGRVHLKARFQKAMKAGDLSNKADPDALSRYLLTVGWGMAVEAQSGSTRKQLHKTADIALKAWSQMAG